MTVQWNAQKNLTRSFFLYLPDFRLGKNGVSWDEVSWDEKDKSEIALVVIKLCRKYDLWKPELNEFCLFEKKMSHTIQFRERDESEQRSERDIWWETCSVFTFVRLTHDSQFTYLVMPCHALQCQATSCMYSLHMFFRFEFPTEKVSGNTRCNEIVLVEF